MTPRRIRTSHASSPALRVPRAVRSLLGLATVLALSACGAESDAVDATDSDLRGGERPDEARAPGAAEDDETAPPPIDPAVALPCDHGKWTCVAVPAAAPYGTATFDVPAAQNWVNTGLYLRRGERATLTTQGVWKASDREGEGIDHGPCKVGAPIARIGLDYKDDALTCLSSRNVFTAGKDGVLFVGALSGNDLGESYETRRNATGKKTFTVTSQGATVPSVASADAARYPFDAIRSGWVEIYGEHVILTLPAAVAKRDAKTLAAATARLDAIYELHAKLRGALPQHGQRLRFFPDDAAPGYMLAGNPIRVKSVVVTGGDDVRISRAGEPGTSNWGFAHEMGHDFSFVGGFWTYQARSLEAWPNVFSVHAFEALGLPLHDEAKTCSRSSRGAYTTDADWSAWTGLCFLLQFRFAHGWSFYEKFFRSINATPTMPDRGDRDKTAWYFLHDRFEAAAGRDVTPVFAAWKVPHP